MGGALSDSNSSINYFHFSVFSVIWGICFSLKANPISMKRSDSGTLLAQEAHLLYGIYKDTVYSFRNFEQRLEDPAGLP